MSSTCKISIHSTNAMMPFSGASMNLNIDRFSLCGLLFLVAEVFQEFGSMASVDGAREVRLDTEYKSLAHASNTAGLAWIIVPFRLSS